MIEPEALDPKIVAKRRAISARAEAALARGVAVVWADKDPQSPVIVRFAGDRMSGADLLKLWLEGLPLAMSLVEQARTTLGRMPVTEQEIRAEMRYQIAAAKARPSVFESECSAAFAEWATRPRPLEEHRCPSCSGARDQIWDAAERFRVEAMGLPPTCPRAAAPVS